jgi:hypothetical protein
MLEISHTYNGVYRVHFDIIHELTQIIRGLLSIWALHFLEDISENTGVLLISRQVVLMSWKATLYNTDHM